MRPQAANNLRSKCGHPVSPDVPAFKSVSVISKAGAKERVVMATAGITFSAVITDSGKGENRLPCTAIITHQSFLVYTFGSGEKGQLGNGKTGERIITGNKLAFDIVTQPSMSLCLFPSSL
jgi:hypothetical protein